MKNTLSNTPTKIFKSVCTSNVYPRLPMALCLVLCMLGLGLSVNASGTTTTITTFDAPGAGTAAGQGTIAFAINLSGAIAGFTRDANHARHGFLRASDGTFTIFDDPNAGSCSASCGNIGNGQGTRAFAINPSGQIVGSYTDNIGRCHGFVRSTDGTFTTYDAPGAGTGAGQGTLPESNNTPGAITGQFIDGNFVNHAFVRSNQGIFSTFDVPGMGTGAGQIGR